MLDYNQAFDLEQIIRHFGKGEFTIKDCHQKAISGTESTVRYHLQSLVLSNFLCIRKEEIQIQNIFGENIASVRYHYYLSPNIVEVLQYYQERDRKGAQTHTKTQIIKLERMLSSVEKDPKILCNFVESNNAYNLKQVYKLMVAMQIQELDMAKAWELYNQQLLTDSQLISIHNKIKRKGENFKLRLTPENLPAYQKSINTQIKQCMARDLTDYIDGRYKVLYDLIDLLD